MMKFKNLEDRLVAIAAVIVLLGVTFAAEDALAENNAGAHLECAAHGTTYIAVAGAD